MRLLPLLVPLIVACNASPRASALPERDAQLHFTDSLTGTEHTAQKRTLAERYGLSLVTGFDPYYQRERRFFAVPMARVLTDAFPGVDLARANLVLRARDGYAVPMVGARLLDGTAWLALADAEHVGSWDVIGPRRADPAPFYLVWSGPDRADLERFPRPWALERIEHTRFEVLYSHTVPTSGSREAQHGYELFRVACIACHAVNREGGRIGPELNVPQSIVEYRPREQIRAYIRDPLTFRYGAMPAHPELTEADLDALLAYFDDMRSHKFDPERAK
ncbi:MAG: cytochrome c [Polyangia bacterium]